MLSIHSNANQVMWGFYVKNIEINIFLLNIIDCFTSTMFIVGTYWILKSTHMKLILIGIMIISMFCLIPLAIDTDEYLVWIGFLGISACLKSISTITFLAISKMFEPVLIPTILTCSNLFTNIAMIIAPQIAELPFPSSIFAFLVSSGITFVLILLIPMDSEKPEKLKS